MGVELQIKLVQKIIFEVKQQKQQQQKQQ